MKRYFAAMPILLGATINASAPIVFVTVKGFGSFGVTPTPPELGNRQFTAEYSYDDSAVKSTEVGYTYTDAVLSFSMTFTGGSTFTATGGDLLSDSQGLIVTELKNPNFPNIAGMQFTGFMVFKLHPIVSVPTDRLPTAQELTTNYEPWFSWIAYDNNINRFTLSHSSFTAVPEPSVALLGLSSLGLLLRRRRDP